MAKFDDTDYQDDEGELDVPEQPLDQDYGTPIAPPPEVDDDKLLSSDHPALDSNLDAHEVYDEGLTNASGAVDQHVGDEEE